MATRAELLRQREQARAEEARRKEKEAADKRNREALLKLNPVEVMKLGIQSRETYARLTGDTSVLPKQNVAGASSSALKDVYTPGGAGGQITISPNEGQKAVIDTKDTSLGGSPIISQQEAKKKVAPSNQVVSVDALQRATAAPERRITQQRAKEIVTAAPPSANQVMSISDLGTARQTGAIGQGEVPKSKFQTIVERGRVEPGKGVAGTQGEGTPFEKIAKTGNQVLEVGKMGVKTFLPGLSATAENIGAQLGASLPGGYLDQMRQAWDNKERQKDDLQRRFMDAKTDEERQRLSQLMAQLDEDYNQNFNLQRDVPGATKTLGQVLGDTGMAAVDVASLIFTGGIAKGGAAALTGSRAVAAAKGAAVPLGYATAYGATQKLSEGETRAGEVAKGAIEAATSPLSLGFALFGGAGGYFAGKEAQVQRFTNRIARSDDTNVIAEQLVALKKAVPELDKIDDPAQLLKKLRSAKDGQAVRTIIAKEIDKARKIRPVRPAIVPDAAERAQVTMEDLRKKYGKVRNKNIKAFLELDDPELANQFIQNHYIDDNLGENILAQRYLKAMSDSEKNGGVIYMDINNLGRRNEMPGGSNTKTDKILFEPFARHFNPKKIHPDLKLVRAGGDEFVFVLNDIPESQWDAVRDSVAANIDDWNKTQKEFRSRPKIEAGKKPEPLRPYKNTVTATGANSIKAADQATYRLKEAGKKSYVDVSQLTTKPKSSTMGVTNIIRKSQDAIQDAKTGVQGAVKRSKSQPDDVAKSANLRKASEAAELSAGKGTGGSATDTGAAVKAAKATKPKAKTAKATQKVGAAVEVTPAPKKVKKPSNKKLPVVSEKTSPTAKKVAQRINDAEAEISRIKKNKVKAYADPERVYSLEGEIEALQESLDSSGLADLKQYADTATGELPEVTGKAKFIRKGARKLSKNKELQNTFAKTGDQIITEYGYKDTEELRAAYAQFVDDTERLKKIKSDYRVVKKDLVSDFSADDIERLNYLADEITEASPEQRDQLIRDLYAAEKSKAKADAKLAQLSRITGEDLKPVVRQKGKLLKPKTARRINAIQESLAADNPEIRAAMESGDLKSIDKLYRQYNIEEGAQIADDFVKKASTDELRDVIRGRAPEPKGTTRTAVMRAAYENAVEKKDYALASEVGNKMALRNVRLGQEIVANRGAVNPDSPLHFANQIIEERMQSLAQRHRDITQRFKTSSKAIAIQAIDEATDQARQVISRDVKKKLGSAQVLIDQLTCK